MLKKMVCTVLALAVFLLVTGVFVGRLRQILPKTMLRQDQSLTYTRPEAAAQETEPAETEAPETLPPQTEPVETEPVAERFYYDAVPRYDQTAYPDILYRSGTIATSGSNITSLAMVASYLTGHEYLPDSLADYFADYIGNSMQWLEYASDQLQLPWWRAGNIDETIQYLREGKLAIVLMNEQSVFMEGQHFVVFTGITEDGKILVQDPYGPNYTAWNLENALINGFDRGDLTGAYGAAWIYDPEEMPEQPFLYEPVPHTDAFRYGSLQLSQEDKELIARLVCMEGESEPFEGQQGIAEVILNRMAADNFPNTASGVIHAEGQFLAAGQLYRANPTHIQYEAVERALNGPYVLDADVVFFSKFKVNDKVWGTIGTHVFCRQW